MLRTVNYFRRKVQSEIFDRVLNAPLMSQTENYYRKASKYTKAIKLLGSNINN